MNTAEVTESGRRYSAEYDCKLSCIGRILSRTKSHHSNTDRVFAEYSRVSIRKLSRVFAEYSRVSTANSRVSTEYSRVSIRILSRIGRILSRIDRKLSRIDRELSRIGRILSRPHPVCAQVQGIGQPSSPRIRFE